MPTPQQLTVASAIFAAGLAGGFEVRDATTGEAYSCPPPVVVTEPSPGEEMPAHWRSLLVSGSRCDADGDGASCGVYSCDPVRLDGGGWECRQPGGNLTPAPVCVENDAPREEACDGKDNDCDGETDEAGASGCTPFLRDDDGDGYGTDGLCLCAPMRPFTATVGVDCEPLRPNAHPGGAERPDDGLDNDCDGETDEN